MIPIQLDHVVINVPNRARSTAFSRNVLGATRIERPAGWADRIGDRQLNCHGPGLDPAPLARVPVLPGTDLCFSWHGDIADAQAHLAANGVAVNLGRYRGSAPGAGTSLSFRDSDGSLLEFIVYEPSSAA